jgi:hypothetical protein
MTSKSYPFVPRQQLIELDQNDCVIINENTDLDLIEDKSYLVAMRLHESVCKNDFNKFKKIYETEYMNPDIVDFFKFEKETDAAKYSGCTCAKGTVQRIHPDMYVRPCNCINGKRYLAYLCVYNTAYCCSYYYNTNKYQDPDENRQYKEYLLEYGLIPF